MRILFIFIILLSNVIAQPQGSKYDTHPMHWDRFIARAIHNKNLIWCPLWNIAKVTDSGLSPGAEMKWPGQNGLMYLNYCTFFVAILVEDMSEYNKAIVPEIRDTKQVPIISYSYTINYPISNDKSHRQCWMPIPGFYNDGKYGWIWGIDEDVDGDGEMTPAEDVNLNGNHDLNLNPPESIIKSMAISTDKRTWPEYWPGGSYIGDDRPYFGRPPRTTTPGLRKGRWNGEYKAGTIADQETVYRMDDHENDYLNDKTPERYWPMKNADGTPDTTPWADGGIAGAGIEVEGRSYTWFHPLAEDLLVSIYRVRNYSDYVLNRVVTGIYANPDIGLKFDNEVKFIVAEFDPSGIGGRLSFDILYQWQKFPELVPGYQKVGSLAFAFLETPGIDYNKIDDDYDSFTDEAMDDGIDNDGDWMPFADTGLDRLLPGDPQYKGPDLDGTEGNGSWDTEDVNLNGALDSGEDKNKNDKLDMEPVNDDRGSDGLGPDENGWPGPDPDGSETNGWMELGEPNFDATDIDEADQAGLKHVHVYESNKDLKDQWGYWNKYLSDPLGEQEVTESDEDICFTFGARGVKLERMEWKRFAIALVMGEDKDDAIRNKVTMQDIYDNNYRFLTPPLQPTLVSNVTDGKVQLYWDTDAESSKDPFFGEDFNGYRVYKSTDPKFLDIKTISDAFGNVLLFEPIAIFDNADGLKGAHPIPFPNIGVHYDMGKDSGLRHSYRDTLVDNGREYFYAVTSIDAGNDDDFAARGLVQFEYPMQAMPSESPFNITVNLLGQVIYRDRNTAVCVPVEPAAGFTEPYVDSLGLEHIGPHRGGDYSIKVFNKHHVNLGHKYEVTFEDDRWLTGITSEYDWGSTTGARCMNLTTGDTLFNYQYPNSYEFVSYGYPELERFIGEGLHFGFSWPVSYKTAESDQKKITVIRYNEKGRETLAWKRWVTPTKSNVIVKAVELSSGALPLPRDFELRVYDSFNADTSYSNAPWLPQHPLNFAVWDITEPENEKKATILVSYDKNRKSGNYLPPEMYGQVWDSVRVVVMFPDRDGRMRESWTVRFFKNEFDLNQNVIPPGPGDIFRIRTERNPTHLDTLRFTVDGGEWSKTQAQEDMRDIYVVPDPYVVSNTYEPIYEIAGATQRRVDFVNLPPQCKISIFTASGKLVRILDHNAPEDFGRESWDLRTDDGPEIAFGIYFFVVEAEGIGLTRGKFAVIK